MGITAEKINIDFIISTGDNFYPGGLRDENDEAFYQSFSDIYTSPALNKMWYTGIYSLQTIYIYKIFLSEYQKKKKSAIWSNFGPSHIMK